VERLKANISVLTPLVITTFRYLNDLVFTCLRVTINSIIIQGNNFKKQLVDVVFRFLFLKEILTLTTRRSKDEYICS